MIKIITLASLAFTLLSCENMYPPDDGIPRIRTQRDVDAYNATVSSESEKLVCSRELVLGSNMRQFTCMTVAQRDRVSAESRELLESNRGALGNN